VGAAPPGGGGGVVPFKAPVFGGGGGVAGGGGGAPFGAFIWKVHHNLYVSGYQGAKDFHALKRLGEHDSVCIHVANVFLM